MLVPALRLGKPDRTILSTLLPIYSSATRAKIPYFAMFAIRLESRTPPSSVPNQPVAKIRPVFLRHQPHEILFDLLRLGLFGQAESVCQSSDVRIDHDAFIDLKSIPQNDIGGLPANPGESNQLGHG